MAISAMMEMGVASPKMQGTQWAATDTATSAFATHGNLAAVDAVEIS